MKPVLPASAPTITRLLLGGACLAGIFYALNHFAGLLVPLTGAVLLTVLVLPLVDTVQGWGVPRSLAAAGTALLSVLALAGVGFVGAMLLLEIAEATSDGQVLRRLLGPVAMSRLDELGLLGGGDGKDPAVETRFMLETTVRVLGGAGSLGLGAITHLLLLWELPDLLARLDNVLSRSLGPQPTATAARVRTLGVELRGYLWVKLAVSLMTAAGAAALMLAVGLDHLLSFTALIFLLNFVPNLGSLLAAIPPVLVAAATLGMTEAVLLGSGLMLVNLVLGNVLEPWWMGGRLSLSPFVVFLGVVIWGAVWGIAGALLSVPLTHLFVLLLESREDTRWLAELLRPTSPDALRTTTSLRIPRVPNPPGRSRRRSSSTLTGL